MPPPGQDGEHQGPGRRNIRTRASLATTQRLSLVAPTPRAALLATGRAAAVAVVVGGVCQWEALAAGLPSRVAAGNSPKRSR